MMSDPQPSTSRTPMTGPARTAAEQIQHRAAQAQVQAQARAKAIQGGNKHKTQPSIQEAQAMLGTTICGDRLLLMSILGIGAYGVVYLARNVLYNESMDADEEYFAVKCLNRTGLDVRQLSFQQREIALHWSVSTHPGVVRLHSAVDESDCIYVMLSYYNEGDLFAMITEKKRYLGDDEMIRSVFTQIIMAIEHCHAHGVYHRDLKPENVLCRKHGSEVVIADFGLATSDEWSSDFGCGSTFYMSPECLGGLVTKLARYSTAQNDIWSLGVILVNLICGRNPWKQAHPSDDTFRAFLALPDFLRTILPLSAHANHILKRLFALNPAARMNLQELKEEVATIKTFTMTEAEVKAAPKAVQDAAVTIFEASARRRRSKALLDQIRAGTIDTGNASSSSLDALMDELLMAETQIPAHVVTEISESRARHARRVESRRYSRQMQFMRQQQQQQQQQQLAAQHTVDPRGMNSTYGLGLVSPGFSNESPAGWGLAQSPSIASTRNHQHLHRRYKSMPQPNVLNTSMDELLASPTPVAEHPTWVQQRCISPFTDTLYSPSTVATTPSPAFHHAPLYCDALSPLSSRDYDLERAEPVLSNETTASVNSSCPSLTNGIEEVLRRTDNASPAWRGYVPADEPSRAVCPVTPPSTPAVVPPSAKGGAYAHAQPRPFVVGLNTRLPDDALMSD